MWRHHGGGGGKIRISYGTPELLHDSQFVDANFCDWGELKSGGKTTYRQIEYLELEQRRALFD